MLKSRTIAAIDLGADELFESRTSDEIIVLFDSSCNDTFAAGIDAAAMIFNHDDDPRVVFGAPSFTMASPVARSVILFGGQGVGTLDMVGDEVDDG